jgi:hypothetical protein
MPLAADRYCSQSDHAGCAGHPRKRRVHLALRLVEIQNDNDQIYFVIDADRDHVINYVAEKCGRDQFDLRLGRRVGRDRDELVLRRDVERDNDQIYFNVYLANQFKGLLHAHAMGTASA